MITPKKLSTIAQEYNPDLLNEWFEVCIKQNSYVPFLSFKDELLEAKNHPEWFLKLLNLAHRNQNNFLKYNVNIWNDFIKICKKEDKNFTIDFSGCTFENEEECSFLGIELPNINFYKAIFKDKADFQVATFEGKVDFQETTFEDEANFEKTTFEDKANFGNTTFEDKANFENANFENEINFGTKKFKNINFKKTTFNSKIDFQNKEFVNTSFENATFEDKANFENATFEDKANFENATFKDKTDFQGATFEDEANFKKAIFKEEANFQRVKFKGETDFFDAIFDNIDGKKIDFSNTTFKKNVKFDFSKGQANKELNTERYVEISFENATFEKKATFRRRKFAGDTSFIDAKFYYPPTFSPGEEYNPDLLNFTRTKLILNSLIPPKFLLSAFIPQTFFLWKQDITILTRVRNLRKLAGQIKEYDFEINLFILERLLNSRINGSKCLQQALIFLYWISSNYGRSALIPTGWLLYSIVVLKDYLDKYIVKNSACSNYDLWLVSSSNAIPFFNKFSEKSKFILQRCFTDSCTVESIKEIPNIVFVYFTIHSLFSIVMIFLFSLAIRNYFRIK